MHRTSVALVVLSLFIVGGCKKQVADPAPPSFVLSDAPRVPVDQGDAIRQLADNFSRVHFALDSSSLDSEARRLLDQNAAILQRHADLRIEIQGHADERGTTDYNVALGMRRAAAVRDQITRMGVSPSRVNTISFGEERPLASGAGERIWSQNRRAEFRVLTPSAAVQGSTGA